MTPTRRIRSGCCGRAADGHVAVAPPRSVMNSRRLICSALGTEPTIVAGQTGGLEVGKLALGKVRFLPQADIVLIIRSSRPRETGVIVAPSGRAPWRS